MRNAAVLVFLLLVGAGCGKPLGGPPPASGEYRIYEAAATQVAVIDSRSHSTEMRLPLGAADSAWTHLYSVTSNTLLDTDPRTGAVARTLQLPAAYQLPAVTLSGMPGGLSPDGSWLVLQSHNATQTNFLIIETATWKVVAPIALDGDFHFDAISNDGQRLYLIQSLNSVEYYVRLYDVPTKVLESNIVVDKADGNQAMAGSRLAGVASPDGVWLFSIYVRQHDNPFIHALSLAGPFAFCLDLPGHGYASANGEAELHWSLAMSHDGSRLYAVNPSTGVVAVASTGANGAPAIVRTSGIGVETPSSATVSDVQAARVGASAAVISADGRTVVAGGASGLVWIDAASLHAQARALNGWRVYGLGLSPDGQSVYALNDAGMIAEVSMSSWTVGSTIDAASMGNPITLMRVAAA